MQSVVLTLFVLLLVLALRTWYVQVYRRKPKVDEDSSPSYLKRESLLLEHEQKYFETLNQVVGGNARVFAKVRLSDLVQPHSAQPEHRAHWLRVQRRCVDFLLCSPTNLTPVLAIDLDTRVKRRRREQSAGGDVLDNALIAARVPLLRVRGTREYDAQEVLHQIRIALATSQEPMPEWFAEPREQGDDWRRSVEVWLPTLSRWTSGLWGAFRRA